MKKSNLVYVLLSILLSVVLLGFLFSQIEFRDFLETLKNISVPLLLVFMGMHFMNSALRAIRYQWLLHPHSIRFGNIFLVTLIRNVFVDLFPARIGSLSYIYILNKRMNFSFEVATSSFVVAFVFDFLTLSPFLITAIFAVGMGTNAISNPTTILISAVFFILIFIVLWKLIEFSTLFVKGFAFITKKLGWEEKRWIKTSIEKLLSTIDCLKDIKNKKLYGKLFGISMLMRLAKYSTLHVLLVSLLKSHGFTFKTLNIWKTILGITGAELTSALPIKGLGGYGTWESAWALTFRLMDFEPRLAIISGLGVHLITNLFEYSIGIISIVILVLPLIRKSRQRNI